MLRIRKQWAMFWESFPIAPMSIVLAIIFGCLFYYMDLLEAESRLPKSVQRVELTASADRIYVVHYTSDRGNERHSNVVTYTLADGTVCHHPVGEDKFQCEGKFNAKEKENRLSL